MFNKLPQMLEDDDEPPSRVHQLLQELQQGIETLKSQIDSISQTTIVQQDKLLQLRDQEKMLKAQAKRAHARKEDFKTRSLFEELVVVADKITQYQQLHSSINQSRIKLQKRLNELEFNRDQIIAKVEVGEVDANASQQYAEIMEGLMLLKNSGELSKHQEAINEAEYKTEALKELTKVAISENTPPNDLSEIAASIKEDQQADDQLAINQLQVKYQHFFESNTSYEATRQKSDRLEALAMQNVAQTKIDEFFENEDRAEPSSEQADRIKNFFGK